MTSSSQPDSGGSSDGRDLKLIKWGVATLLGLISIICGVNVSELIGVI